MISVKIGGIIAVAAFAAGSLFAPPVQQAIAAVIATDVQCTGCVGTSDLAGNAVTAAKIKDGEVKGPEIAANAVGSSEIATDAVGAAELQGVTKLLYGVCSTSQFQGSGWANGAWSTATCIINGAATGDNVMAFLTGTNINMCYEAIGGWVDSANNVKINVRGSCTSAILFNTAGTISIIVYHK